MAVVMSLFIAALSLTGCAEEVTQQGQGDDGRIRFSATLVDGRGDVSITRAVAAQDTMSPILLAGEDGQTLYLHRRVTAFPVHSTTRSTMINNVATDLKALGCFGVSGYHYDPTTQTESSVSANFFYNAKATESGGEWRTSEPYYFPAGNERMVFYGYAPYTANGDTYDVNHVYGNNASEHAPMILEYTVNPDPVQQTDLITAVSNNQTFDPGTEVTMPFRHALTAVRFVLGSDVALGWTLKELSIEKVISHARYMVGTGWMTNEGDATTATFTLDLNKSTDDEDRSVTNSTQTFLMIPQTFTNNQQQLTIKMSKGGEDKTLHYKLNGNTWTAGTVVTYAITTSSVNLVTANIAYPEDWGGEAFELKSAYDNGAAVGVYAVDVNTKKIVTANMKLVYDKTAGTWSTEDDDVLKYNRNYDYYVYAPYQSTLSGGRALGDSYTGSGASDFFSGVVNGWTVADDQSTAEKLLANDLHIGQAVHDAEHFTHVNVSMQHALGLAKVTLETVDVTPRYNLSPGNTSAATQNYVIELTDKLIYRASNQGISDYMCPNSDLSVYHHIYKGAVNQTFMSTSTGEDQWKSSLSGSIVNGQCYKGLAELKTVPELVEYDGWYFDYTGGPQTFIVPSAGIYQIECWGAQGASSSVQGGYGSYTKGLLSIDGETALYLYVGQYPGTNNRNAGWNGGGKGVSYSQTGYAGGGATDIRLTNGDWDNFNSLKSRIMVAAGGGGSGNGTSSNNVGRGGQAGGLNGYHGVDPSEWGPYCFCGLGATQTEGGNFGINNTYILSFSQYINETNNIRNSKSNQGGFGYGAYDHTTNCGGPGGGGGYYGGGAGNRAHSGGGGGSSFISGHEGCDAVGAGATSTNRMHTGQPNHYSGYVFTNTKMIDGAGYEWTTTKGASVIGVPKTLEGGREAIGHTGNGFVRIIKIQ